MLPVLEHILMTLLIETNILTDTCVIADIVLTHDDYVCLFGY